MIELQLLNKILTSRDMSIVTKNEISPEHFTAFRNEFEFILDHYNNYGNVPDKETMLAHFPNSFELIDVQETDKYLVDTLYDDYGFRISLPILNKYKQILEVNTKDAYDYLISNLDVIKPREVSYGVDIISQAHDRYEAYLKKQEQGDAAVIKTGFVELDDVFNGWEMGEELVTVVARTNQGKCLEKGTKVRMHDGTCKPVENIVVGDKVRSMIGSNIVVDLHKGTSNGFKILLDDNTSFVVSSDHYITVLFFENASQINKSCFDSTCASILDIKIEQFISSSELFKRSCFMFKIDHNEVVPKVSSIHSFTIQPVDSVEYYGFECDGDHRFLLEDGTVTHNSWLVVKFLAEAWKQGKRVGLYSGEMSPNKLGYRLDSVIDHFSNKALSRGYEQLNYKEYIESLSSVPTPFVIVTPDDFKGRATVPKLRNFVEQHNLDILGVDQYSLMKDFRIRRNDAPRMALSHISEDLFGLSTDYKIPVIALAQANRAGVKDNDEAPGLEHIKESDDISHNSSKVISMRQASFGLVLEILKNREGRVGDKLYYNWDIDTGYFSYIPVDGDAVTQPTRTAIKQASKDSYQDVGNPF